MLDHCRREILALQAENLALEKQLHSYQMSLAKANTRNSEDFSTVNDNLTSNNRLSRQSSQEAVVTNSRQGSQEQLGNPKSRRSSNYDAPVLNSPRQGNHSILSRQLSRDSNQDNQETFTTLQQVSNQDSYSTRKHTTNSTNNKHSGYIERNNTNKHSLYYS